MVRWIWVGGQGMSRTWAASPGDAHPCCVRVQRSASARHRSAKCDVIEATYLVSEPGKPPAPSNGKLHHSAVHAICTEKWVDMGEIVEDQKASRFDLGCGRVGIATHTAIGNDRHRHRSNRNSHRGTRPSVLMEPAVMIGP